MTAPTMNHPTPAQTTPQVRKTVLTLTILHPADEAVAGRSLDDIAAEIDSGGWIGSTALLSAQLVAPADLPAECHALGSDASFFALASWL